MNDRVNGAADFDAAVAEQRARGLIPVCLAIDELAAINAWDPDKRKSVGNAIYRAVETGALKSRNPYAAELVYDPPPDWHASVGALIEISALGRWLEESGGRVCNHLTWVRQKSVPAAASLGKLTPAQRDHIVARWKVERNESQLARDFNVSRPTIHAALKEAGVVGR